MKTIVCDGLAGEGLRASTERSGYILDGKGCSENISKGGQRFGSGTQGPKQDQNQRRRKPEDPHSDPKVKSELVRKDN